MEVVVPAGDPTAVVAYSHRVFTHAIRGTPAAKLMSLGMNPKDQCNFVQLFDELTRGPGDTIKYDLILNAQGPGVPGDAYIAGQEIPFGYAQASLTINQLRQSILIGGRMSQQRVPYSMRDSAKVTLGNWWKETISYGLLNQLGGNTFISNAANIWGTNMSGMQAPIAPTSDHQIFAGTATSEATLTPNDIFSIDLIPQLVEKAQGNVTFPIKPVVIKDVEIAGVLFLTPKQVRDLKTNFTQGEWGDIMRAALQGGQVTGNPIFTGAIGMIDNVVIHQDVHCPWGDTTQNTVILPTGGTSTVTVAGPGALGVAAAGVSNIHRGIFVGAQAAAFAVGGSEGPDGSPLRVKWIEELIDGADKLRITSGMLFGISKTQFLNTDYATLVVSTWANQ